MRVDGFSQVHGPQGLRPPHHLQGADRAAPGEPGHATPQVDKVEISPAALDAVRAAEGADDRQALIHRIRQQIAAGTYDTSEKLDRAVDRLLDDIG